MCEYFSCIITRKQKVLWDINHVSHEDMINKHNLKDDKLENRNFVKIEITPKTIKQVTRKKSDWVFKVDETDTLPKWFTKKQEFLESLCWKEWTKSVKTQISINNETKTVNEGLFFTYDNSTVEAYGNSTVTARNNSTVTASDNSTVTARENSTVEAYGNSTVTAGNNSTVTARENSTVTARNNSTVTAWENSTVEAYGNSTVTASDNSIIIIELLYNGNITLKDESQKIKRKW